MKCPKALLIDFQIFGHNEFQWTERTLQIVDKPTGKLLIKLISQNTFI